MQDSANQTFSVDYQTALQVEGGRDMFYDYVSPKIGGTKNDCLCSLGAGHGFAVINRTTKE